MRKLKWYSGGDERSDQAIVFIVELLSELSNNPKNASLLKVLDHYKSELERKESAVLLILSRMNIDISGVIRKGEISLTQTQSNKLKKLRSLSNIRYSYY
ncbi:bacteriocin immunity protein [Listeria aquatica]|uniref:Bacteriocin immunity protein n=1 Tax=Listeria aquatica TaxID=1494960 RepID=A0A841ZQY2_9LIST|nr:bacteriocin immunity protein [Listeria aquatica]MBC1521718.1 bacteriocin immunity protein [Listeria aquatica]